MLEKHGSAPNKAEGSHELEIRIFHGNGPYLLSLHTAVCISPTYTINTVCVTPEEEDFV